MTTPPITATLPSNYSIPTSAQSASQITSSTMNSNTFLQLLVAQLQYQNPNSPTDPTQYLSETATFQEVEQLQSMETSISSLTASQQSATSVGLLGQQVQATASDGSTVTGVVSAIQMGGSGPELTIGNQQVPLSSVTEVMSSAAASAAAAPSASAPAASAVPGGGGSGAAP